MSRNRERGGSKLKAILWLLVFVAGALTAFKVVPVYIDNYSLQDKMLTEARFATVNHPTEDRIRDDIFKEIQELEIPAHREDIKVEASSRGVKISVDYTVNVDLKVYQLKLHFSPAVDNRSLY